MMKDIFTPKPIEDAAEFNNAFAFLERLSKTEYLIQDALMRWNLRDAFAFLESYEDELDFSFKEKEQEDIDGIKINISTILNDYPHIGEIKKDPNNKKYIVGRSKTGELRGYLIELNKTLRRIKFKRGMGMPLKGDSKLF